MIRLIGWIREKAKFRHHAKFQYLGVHCRAGNISFWHASDGGGHQVFGRSAKAMGKLDEWKSSTETQDIDLKITI